MSLTYNQKKNLSYTIIPVVILALIVGICWTIVALWPSGPAQATVNTPPVPQVNASHYVQINTGDNDGPVDHFCVGTDGIFFGQDAGDFSTMKNDPLCGGK